MDLRKSITFAGISSSVLFALTSILSGLFTRWGVWDFRTGLSVLKWSAIGEAATVIAASAACIITLYRKTWDLLIISILAFIISTASVGVPLKWFLSARRVPPIHDITTDTENPPQFATILKLRENASNPSGYGGPDISSKQLAAYPDIRPALLNVPPEKAFDICLATVREMGWELVDSNPAKGTIEATDTTFWFGFKDDIVIRVSPYDKGSRVDARSVSRVGVSDAGTNAKRIRSFLSKVRGLIPSK